MLNVVRGVLDVVHGVQNDVLGVTKALKTHLIKKPLPKRDVFSKGVSVEALFVLGCGRCAWGCASIGTTCEKLSNFGHFLAKALCIGIGFVL